MASLTAHGGRRRPAWPEILAREGRRLGAVFPYGRVECDSSLAYGSVILFGRIRAVEEEAARRRFRKALMTKYGNRDWDRLKGFFSRLDEIAVYAIAVERMTGKETPLPNVSEQWPAMDRTRSPEARPA